MLMHQLTCNCYWHGKILISSDESCSPYSTPCDLYLLSNLKTHLIGKIFGITTEIIDAVNDFGEFDKSYFPEGIETVECRDTYKMLLWRKN